MSDDSDEDQVPAKKIIESDEEEEDVGKNEETSPVIKKAKILSDSEEDENEEYKSDDQEDDKEEGSPGHKRSRIILDSDEDEDEDETDNKRDGNDEVNTEKESAAPVIDDDDDDDDENDQNEDEDEDEKQISDQPDDEEEDEDDNRGSQSKNTTIYDFDIMMAKKKEENSRKRKRRNYDIINDNDDIIADIINQMKDAVEADCEANKNKQAATQKLKLLPFVISQLRKVDMKEAFLDSDVLSVITEWLAPLPDRSLPHLNIRESLLKVLIDLNLYDVDRIKASGIGKAVMYLYKHPKESKENKQRAKQLISCWSRPIFQLDSSFTAISREEREQRDLELMNKHRRLSKQNDSSDGEGAGTSSGTKKNPKEEPAAQKPGDKGWIPRARVPAPSMKDYVIRPRSKVDGDVGKSSRRPANMLEKYMKSQQERRRAGRQQRAVNMKIDRV